MTWFSVDIEADGPIPGDYSMIQLGACRVDDPSVGICLNIQPISEQWVPEALAVSGFTRDQTLEFSYDAYAAMNIFGSWLSAHCDAGTKPVFIADNNGFDWMFVCWYFHHFTGGNPFGFSSRNINDLFHGIKLDMKASFKRLRPTAHTHNALDDARANAGALLVIQEKYKLKAKW